MTSSLQDQLLKAGLSDEKKVKKMAKAKRKEANLARHSGEPIRNESKEAAKLAMAQKIARDRELNQIRNSKAQDKAINAQIRQLIEANKLRKGQGDVGFHFTDDNKVKKLYVTRLEQRQLLAGALSIVKQDAHYEILPRAVADKIGQRDERRVVSVQESTKVVLTEEEQGWYKDYEIPDDLMW